MEEIRIALFGIGGYAENYVRAMKSPQREKVRLVGAVDPYKKDCPLCPVYDTAEELFAAQSPHIAVIGTPIPFHADHAITAFRHGCHVVLEKPIASTLRDGQAILAARDQAGTGLSVGFQLCYEPAMRALKRDIASGLYGAPLSLRAIVLPPRDGAYYRRGSGWAGKKYDSAGRPIFDDVLSNSTAHYLMNMLYLTGAPLSSLRCAAFRANPIETFDTAVLKAKSESGAEIFMAVSHAAGRDYEQPPYFEYVYEGAVIRFGRKGARGDSLRAFLPDGAVRDYGSLDATDMENLWNMVDHIREGAPIPCTGEDAILEADAMEKVRAAVPEAVPFPDAMIREDAGMRWVPGLHEALWQCYESRTLPAWELWNNRL